MADTGLPFLPGTSTVSEVLAALEPGLSEMKFFPAEASGGAAYLGSVASPVPAARFCPTGGITSSSASSYLALPNVGCVGGSWITPAGCSPPARGSRSARWRRPPPRWAVRRDPHRTDPSPAASARPDGLSFTVESGTAHAVSGPQRGRRGVPAST